jgi:NAD+ diphosphatase
MLHLPLSRAQLHRHAELRTDINAQNELEKSGIFYGFHDGKFIVEGEKLRQFSHSAKPNGRSEQYFLGVDDSGQGHFLQHFLDQPSGELQLQSLRSIAKSLSAQEIGIAVQGQGLALWHASHPRCAKCGKTTDPEDGGYVRRCEEGHQHHPRTDPAVIVLVKDSADRILLGHQSTWDEGRFSTFAGFVEPGESFEAAVIREVEEEAGVRASEMVYLGSQPWPFPASVMIAFEALVEDPQSARPDGVEITEIGWWSREELKGDIASGKVHLPPLISVARAMINRWYGPTHREDLSGKESWR